MSRLLLRYFVFLTALCVLGASSQAQQNTEQLFDGNSWWSHVKVLADDNMEGRGTGSEGLRRAEVYIVDQFKKAGLEPAGTEGFYQSVKFVQHEIVESASSASLQGIANQPLVFGDDMYFGTHVDLAEFSHSPVEGNSLSLSAPLVFVGNGLKILESNLDELTGQDLRGKIVVFISGSPAEISGELASHYSGLGERWKALHAAGAIGIISIPNPASMDIPWSRIKSSRTQPSMSLAGAEFNEVSGLRVVAVFNPASADKLFAGSGHTFAELAALAKDRKPLPHFPLKPLFRATVNIRETPVESANVVAKLPGSDPKLKDEYVVLSAHADHLGIGEPINGDRIYNGAMDDASGVATVLDVAASLKAHPEATRRSILFLIVIAEEKGLLGSRYFAAHPTVPKSAIVGDVNIDMFLPIIPMKSIKIIGLAESDLGDRASDVAKWLGIRPIPDPEPLRNAFVRSDQYSFIRQGIPAVKMDVGFDLNTPEHKTILDWRTQRYHAPSDDLAQPVDLASAALYEQFIRNLLISTANADARPAWKTNSFFRRFAHANSP